MPRMYRVLVNQTTRVYIGFGTDTTDADLLGIVHIEGDAFCYAIDNNNAAVVQLARYLRYAYGYKGGITVMKRIAILF